MAEKNWIRFGVVLQILSWGYVGLVLYGLLVFIEMTLHDIFDGIEFHAWVWILSSMFPLLFLILHLNLSAELSWREFRKKDMTVYYFSIGFYMLILLITFQAMIFWVTANPADDSDTAIDDYITMSYLWLIPCQIIIFVIIRLIVKNARILFKFDPDKLSKLEHRIQQIDVENEEKKAYRLLSEAKFSQLFNFLTPLIVDQEERNTLITIQSRFNTLRQTRLRRTESTADLNTTLNQIASDLTELINLHFQS